jgi:hypothetical protein
LNGEKILESVLSEDEEFERVVEKKVDKFISP